MNLTFFVLLCFSFIFFVTGQDCGCSNSRSSCREEGCSQRSKEGGCSGGCGGASNYNGNGGYQRDDPKTFHASLERFGKRNRKGKRYHRRNINDDDNYDFDDKDDRYQIGSLNSVNYDTEYDESERRRKPSNEEKKKIRDPKNRRFRYKRSKRDDNHDNSDTNHLCNNPLIKRALEMGMESLLSSNQTSPLSLSPASSLHALMKTRSKKSPSPWGVICGPSSSMDQLDLSIDTKMYCYHSYEQMSCFAFRIY